MSHEDPIGTRRLLGTRAGRSALLLALLALPASCADAGRSPPRACSSTTPRMRITATTSRRRPGCIYTDNVDLTPDGSGDTLAMIGLVGQYQARAMRRASTTTWIPTSRSSSISVRLSRPSRSAISMASAEFKIVPGLFSWTGARYLQPGRPQSVAAGDARQSGEHQLHLTTGPTLHLPPTLRTTIVTRWYLFATWTPVRSLRPT